MKKILSIIFIVVTMCSNCFGDITQGEADLKKQIVSNFRTWGAVETHLIGAIISMERELNNAIKAYQLIPTDSPIYLFENTNGTKVVPRAEMTIIYNRMRNSINSIKAEFPVYLEMEAAE